MFSVYFNTEPRLKRIKLVVGVKVIEEDSCFVLDGVRSANRKRDLPWN